VPVGFFLVVILAVPLIVVTTKGSFRRLGRVQFRSLGLLFAAMAIQIALEYVDFPKDRIDDLGLAILLSSYVLIFAFCYANRSLQGMWIIAIGVALNVLVISLNQGMPASDDVVRRGGRDVHVPIERTVKHKPESNDDLLPFLGDVFSLPGDNAVFSIGDIVLGLGIVDICFEASRKPRRPEAPLPL
jgi:hypothetical protein